MSKQVKLNMSKSSEESIRTGWHAADEGLQGRNILQSVLIGFCEGLARHHSPLTEQRWNKPLINSLYVMSV